MSLEIRALFAHEGEWMFLRGELCYGTLTLLSIHFFLFFFFFSKSWRKQLLRKRKKHRSPWEFRLAIKLSGMSASYTNTIFHVKSPSYFISLESEKLSVFTIILKCLRSDWKLLWYLFLFSLFLWWIYVIASIPSIISSNLKLIYLLLFNLFPVSEVH